MKISEEIIKEVNEKCPYDQGIFVQPYGIPDRIKEPVVYSRYKSGGVRGGSCWDSSDPQPYTEIMPKDHMAVLDILLEKLVPSLSFLQYKHIQRLIVSNEETDWEYYGNRTDYVIEYIPVSELEKALEEILNNA